MILTEPFYGINQDLNYLQKQGISKISVNFDFFVYMYKLCMI